MCNQNGDGLMGCEDCQCNQPINQDFRIGDWIVTKNGTKGQIMALEGPWLKVKRENATSLVDEIKVPLGGGVEATVSGEMITIEEVIFSVHKLNDLIEASQKVQL